jgi:WD40 repeat protein/energy-coupling factor transporter ATP-binding protein EcfA2
METRHSFDVFLSYNSSDKTAVEIIARRLEDEENLRPWLDKWNLVPGEPWQEAIEQDLDASRTCAVFLGREGIGPWENEEMRAALRKRVGETGFRVIPVLLPGASLPERGKLPPFLSGLTWVDFRSALDDPPAFRRLVAGIRGTAPGRDDDTRLHLPDIECPYRGLEVFEDEHKKFFVGREAMTQHVIEALRHNRFIAILGSSGSGKSSLVRAGIIPKLKLGELTQSEHWAYITLKPGAHPLSELALGLVGATTTLDSLERVRVLLSSLESDERSLHLYTHLSLSGKPKNTLLFLFIDQFEEIMTLCKEDKEREQFLLNLRYASTISGGRIVTLITMRADFMGRAAAQRNLAEMLSGHQFVVTNMTDTDLQRAIEEPAMLVGLKFEKGLVERILKEVGHEPGALPLLEDALMQLYENRNAENVATLQAYQQLGGVHGALAKRADKVYEEFSPEEQKIVRRVLLALVQPGEGVEDTRRRGELDELWPDYTQRDSVEKVVERLVDARLLTMSSDLKEEQTVDVAHEALIRGWPRLRKWIDEEREALRIHYRVSETAREWRNRNRDVGFLYRGVRLAEALEWRKNNDSSLNELERKFLEASDALQRRENRASWMRLLVAVTVLLITLVLGLFAIRWYEQQQAATLHELASRSGQIKRTDPELSLRLALEAEHISRTAEVESALRQALGWLQEATVLRGHSSRVNSVAFSPDGKQVVTASGDNTAKIWDAQTGQLFKSLDHRGEVYIAAFNRDGTRIVTASTDTTACIWDTQTGQLLHTLKGHSGEVNNAVFSPDGEQVATVSDDKTLRIWSTHTGQQIFKLYHDDVVWRVVYSPNGEQVVTVSQDKTARIWDAHKGELQHTLRHHKEGVIRVDFSLNGEQVVTGGLDNTACIWNARTGDLFKVLDGHSNTINSVAFSPDGKQVATASGDNTARIWDATTGILLQELRGHSNSIHSVAFSPNGRHVITASEDNTARIWDVGKGKLLSELRGHSGEVWSAVYNRDGNKILTGSWDKTARIWDARIGQPLQELRGHSDEVYDAVFSPDGKQVVTASADKTARLWDADTGQPLFEPLSHSGKVTSAAFSPDGKQVVTASADKTAQIWDTHTGKLISILRGHDGAVTSAAFGPDGKQVVTASADKTARIWDADTGKLLLILSGHGEEVTSAAFSPNGRQIVTASKDKTARIWDAHTGKLLFEPLSHIGEVYSAAYSPNSGQIVTAGRDKTARIWDAHTGQLLFELRGHRALVNSAAFSPDGKQVVTASADKTARVWDADTGVLLFELYGSGGNVYSAAFSPANGRQILTAGADRIVRIYSCEECSPIEELVNLANARNPRPLAPGERRIYLHER